METILRYNVIRTVFSGLAVEQRLSLQYSQSSGFLFQAFVVFVNFFAE